MTTYTKTTTIEHRVFLNKPFSKLDLITSLQDVPSDAVFSMIVDDVNGKTLIKFEEEEEI